MRALTPLRVKSAGGRSGYCLMVSRLDLDGTYLVPHCFSADKSMSILLGRPICLRDEDCTVHFPKEVDDELLVFTQ
jgi:hypothetical protein